MSSQLKRMMQKTLKISNRFFGEQYGFRGAHIIGIANYTPNEKDYLRFEQGSLPNSVVKIEADESCFNGEEPQPGEYLTQTGRLFEIFMVDYFGSPKNCYVLYCSVKQR